jgi:guanine nucleotide-binding protein G(o) subunit alpha
MGCGSSSEAPQNVAHGGTTTSPGQQAEFVKNLNIEREIERARQEEEGKVKLLLLGAGESGKSTVFKQMRIIYGGPRTDDDIRMYGVAVRSNIIVAVRKLASSLRRMGLESQLDAESMAATAADREDVSGMTPRQAYDEIIAYLVDNTAEENYSTDPQTTQDWVGQSPRAGLAANNDAKQFLQHVEAIRVLWQCAPMKRVWAKRAAFNIIDSHKEYLQDLTRIASPDYRPTQQDILLARIRTTQIVLERYKIDGIDFEMYDVGGQRSERRKWIDCFDHVDAVIFVAALSEYDQHLAEAKRTNRMVEALELFRSVCNNAAFTTTSIMLFLNKKDIFAEKILYSDIADQRPFCDYAGPPKDFDHGVMYFITKFKDCLIDDEFHDSFIHVTCATDTNNMEFVLDSSRTIIMTDNLRQSGFLGTE